MKARLAAPAAGSPAPRAAGSATVPSLASVIGNRAMRAAVTGTTELVQPPLPPTAGVQLKFSTGRAPGGSASHQARAHGGGLGAAAVYASAARGVATSWSALPHASMIQRSFGRHDISSIQAHVGGAAAASATQMGADAYATGNHVVLGKGTDLFTVAHEAAHVIQQRAGVQLHGGVGAAGDQHEQHADAVAARVSAGQSAEVLLDAYAGQGAAGPQVQCRFKHGGLIGQNVWTDKAGRQFTIDLSRMPTVAGGIELTFHPLGGGQDVTFVVPAKIGDSQFQGITSDAIHYVDSGRTQSYDDLDEFTGYQTPDAKSAFPEIASSDRQPEYHSTSFLGRVSLIPIASTEGGQLHKASELWVADVKISNDRPPTKFGAEGQRSHTVAWSLLRAALQKLGGQQLDKFVDVLAEMSKDLEAPPNTPNTANASAAATVLFNRVGVGLAEIKDPTKVKDLAFWQLAASELVGQFVHAYQLSEAATYADSLAVGHGEPAHMATLRAAESAMEGGLVLNPNQIDEVKKAAVGMLDFKQRLGDKIIGEILQHWMNDLQLAFPRVMNAHRADIVAGLGMQPADIQGIMTALGGKNPTQPIPEIATKLTAIAVTSGRVPPTTALPRDNRSTFVANVVVVPTASVARVGLDNTETDADTMSATNTRVDLGNYSIEQLQIDRLDVADDRPNTRFGVLQRSHTVAWTLVRRHLKHFGGKPAPELAKFVVNELTTLEKDIDKLTENRKIVFDAPGAARDTRTNLLNIISDRGGFPLHQWQTLLSELVETYVTLYQLSRSATYSKEERPKGHGEATALRTLRDLEGQVPLGGLQQFFDNNKDDILESCISLVDAVVATSSLKPENWRIAIKHWMHLVTDYFPKLAGLPGFEAELKKKIAVMEPQAELLAGYTIGLSDRDKTLVNLYENARKEVKTVPDDFLGDLQSSIRLKLASVGQPPDLDLWNKIVNGLKLTRNQTQGWQTHIQSHMAQPKRGAAPRNTPDANAIGKMITDVGDYFQAVKNDRPALIKHFFDSMEKAANTRDPKNTGGFVTASKTAIENALGDGIDEAIELSAASTIENYNDWYDLINKIPAGTNVDFEAMDTAIG